MTLALRDKVERVVARANLCTFCRDWAEERAAMLLPDEIAGGECGCERARAAVHSYRRRQARLRKKVAPTT